MGSQSMSPTVLGTQAGAIMGTAGYMAPEQVTGESVDHRADLFAFGCVLYELVFGERAFSGRNIMQTLDLILAEQPRRLENWPAQQPWPLRWVLGRCLDKNPERRCQSAADLVADLTRLREELASGAALTATPSGPAAATAAGGMSPMLRGAVLGVAVLAAAIGGAAVAGLWSAEPDPTLAVSIPIEGGNLDFGNRSFALSPDGQLLAYVGGDDDSLRIRRLSSFATTTLPGTQDADAPFFSPDGEWIGYFTGGSVYKVRLAGGAPQLVGSASERYRGGTWTDDGVILMGSGIQTEGIYALAATGASEPYRVRSPLPDRGEVNTVDVDQGILSLERPLALPGSDWFLATREAFNDKTMIAAISRDGAQLREVMPGWDARYADGILYVADDVGGLVAADFDPVRAELRGTPFALSQRVMTRSVGAALYDVSANGTLLYMPNDGSQRATNATFAGQSVLVWTDMQGLSRTWPYREEANYSEIRISPDGRQALATVADDDENWRIRVIDLERGVASELPIGDLRTAGSPVWTPDGRSVIFSGTPPGQTPSSSIFRQLVGAEPGTDPQLLHSDASTLTPGSVSPDGAALALTACIAECGIYFLELGESEATPFGYDELMGADPEFSPDGSLLAYIALEGGRLEAFVRPYPGPGGRVRVSREGAVRVVWAPDGNRLYYSTPVGRINTVVGGPSSMMTATIEREPSLRVTGERLLFKAPGMMRRFVPLTSGPELIDFDIAASGDRFLTLSSSRTGIEPAAQAAEGAPETSMRLITRWSDEVRRLDPEER